LDDGHPPRDVLVYTQAGGLQQVAGYAEFLISYEQFPQKKGWVGEHRYSYFDMKAYAIKKLWVLQDHVQKQIDEWKKDLVLEGPVCGFHLRRGDKVEGGMAEAREEEMSHYFQLALDSGIDCKTCFIASDNITGAVHDATITVGDFFPDCNIQSLKEEKVLVDNLGYSWGAFRSR